MRHKWLLSCAAAAFALGLATEMAQAARQHHTISISSLRSDVPSSCRSGEE